MTELEPLQGSATSAWYAPIYSAAASGAFELPEATRIWARSLNIASAGAAAASREHADRFPTSWLDQTIASRALGFANASFIVPLDASALQAAADELAELEQEERVVRIRRDLLEETLNKTADFAPSAFSEDSLLPGLRTAMEQVFIELRKLPPDCPRDAQTARDASSAGQEAYRTLLAAESRYSAIRQAFTGMRRSPFIHTKDVFWLFGDSPIWPAVRTPMINLQPFRPAGPPGGLDRLLWLARPGNGWLPTVAEQNQVFQAFRRAASQRRG
jgi:hypothetical protein